MFHPDREAEFTELLSSLGQFMDSNVLPLSPKFDTYAEKHSVTRKALLSNGICRIPYPERHEGLALPSSIYAMAIEMAGGADAGLAMSVAIHNTASEGIYLFGSEGQKKKYLGELVTGRKLGAFALTEPTSGSDAKGIHTTARKDGKEYLLNGAKMFITNAGEADLYFVFAATEKGPSAFVIESGSPGLVIGEDLKKLGMRGSRTAEVKFNDCRVPEENLIGKEGDAYSYATRMLSGSRIVMGSLCVGIAQLAFDKAVAYSKQRTAFGQPISSFQLTREKIANMKTDISASRLLCLYAALLKDQGAEFSSEAAQAKVFATEASVRTCDQAIQIFGGYGYTSDDLHRHWRDARLLTIGEGTSEVLRLLIASRELAKAA
jgi:butyryl-CoA dehydrogenase